MELAIHEHATPQCVELMDKKLDGIEHLDAFRVLDASSCADGNHRQTQQVIIYICDQALSVPIVTSATCERIQQQQ